MNNEIKQRVDTWLNGDFDPQTKDQIREMMRNNPEQLADAFYTSLEFGTGGLRGIMGPGTNRMNVYTVGMATQGLCNYLNKTFRGQTIKVVVGYDNRNNNTLFAETVANIFAANGITAYVFKEMRPTPELSFAIRQLGCKSGVMITASHNPKEYNGYKAYWEDGAQVIAPHDTNIIDEVNKITGIDQVKWKGDAKNIIAIDEGMDRKFIEMVVSHRLSEEAVRSQCSMPIVYTPIHGTGAKIMPAALKAYGFENVHTVAEQCVADGNFPTVIHPNPEDPRALAMAIELGNKIGAELVMASDPDADRIAVAVRDKSNHLIPLNGNQTVSLLTYYMLRMWEERGLFKGNEYVIKTIVTTELMRRIAEGYGVECFSVLTGFKYIAEVIHRYEGKKRFIGGGEESYGYMIGEAVRDKDSISSGAMFAELTAWAKTRGQSVLDLLEEVYRRFGFFLEGQVAITKQGMEGLEEIRAMMNCFRCDPPKTICGSRVVVIKDYQIRVAHDLVSGSATAIDLPVSNVLQFITEDHTIVSVRPSGTEPKIKFYFGVCEPLTNADKLADVEKKAQAKIDAIIRELDLK